jgi:hypothetical protein
MERREFLQAMGTSVVLGAGMTANAQTTSKPKPRPKGSKSVAEMVAPQLKVVRVGFIGVGARGSGHVSQMCLIDGVEVKAICDIHAPSLEESIKDVVEKHKRPAPTAYGRDKDDYKRMLERDDIDIVIIATPWQDHARMAIDTMNSGKHAFVEVPIATTVEECWQLVDTSERTQRHCMMMENVNYGREELLVLNMVQKGVFGDLIHGEAAYIHDLRGQMNEVEHGTGSWRTYHYAKTNGNLYPTHGLGPVAHYMDINRGDAFDYMVSVGSPALMRNAYAKENFPEGHQWRKLNFTCADLNTSIIKTKRGRTIMVQWDEQLPRPYTRHNFIQGTKGCFGGFPNRIAVEDEGKDADSWTQGKDLKPWYDKYEHPLFKRMGEEAKRNGGHGGMDFLMLWRIIYCLRNGLPLDQDVYDGVAWSVVTPLSAISVANRGRSMDFPDFTRGQWATRKSMLHETMAK